MTPQRSLILGGARSGKSAYAEQLAHRHGARKIYIATAEAGDEEMAARIAHHRRARGDEWQTVEEKLHLPRLIANARQGEVLLVDCLTLWLSNILESGHQPDAQAAQLCDAIAQTRAALVMVSNEVGLGIVPDNALARAFRDHAGRLHQRVAAVCDHVVFVAAGLPMVLK